MADRLPTSRLARTALLGRLAVGEALRLGATQTKNLARSEEDAKAALARRQVRSADEFVRVLGTMKGVALKLGQVASYFDAGMLPDEQRDELQRALATLRDAVPHVSFTQIRRVVEHDLGSIGKRFAAFEEEPFAAASIGQVHRARLPDGRAVAVKVQYPRVAAAVRADLRNVGLIVWLARRVAPELDGEAIAHEMRRRVEEELDYELEAQNQRALARAHRNHPFIVVPDVVTELSTESVLTTELVDGAPYGEVLERPQDERDRYGEILFRFYFGCLFRHGQFSGDPHPGNALLLEDGRVAFLDFGLYKRLPQNCVELERRVHRAVLSEDAQALIDAVPDGGRADGDELLFKMRQATWWYASDETVALTPETANEAVLAIMDPRSGDFDPRHWLLGGDHLLVRRLETLLLAVLAKLRARGNWHRVMSEWLFDGTPAATPLGELERRYYYR